MVLVFLNSDPNPRPATVSIVSIALCDFDACSIPIFSYTLEGAASS